MHINTAMQGKNIWSLEIVTYTEFDEINSIILSSLLKHIRKFLVVLQLKI